MQNHICIYNTYMTTTNQCTQSFIDSMTNRRYALAYTAPPPRIDSLAQSPYAPNILNPTTKRPYTQFDLNMRRKAEILKYSSNTQSTQTNNLTKKQQWAQIANGNYQRFSPTLYQSNTNPATGAITYTLKCDVSGGIIYTPTTSSDVPGPIINLYDDPNVLLYMYQTNQDAYAIIPNTVPPPFQYKDMGISIVDSPVYKNYFDPVLFSNMIVTDGIKQSFTKFTVTVPVGIRFTGRVAETDDFVKYTFTYPTNTALNVYYGSTNIPNNSIPYDTVTNPNTSYQLNGVFLNGQSSNTIEFRVLDTSQPFVFDAYIGSVQFTSIQPLATQPLMVYSFAFSLINLSNSVFLVDGVSTDTIAYDLMVNPPDPTTNPYYAENSVDLTPNPTYYPMSVLPLL